MKKLTIICVLCAFIVSCASIPFVGKKQTTARDIHIEKLAIMLNDSLRRPALKNKEIGILTFANLNNLNDVEPLGRFLQEELAHALFELGFRIKEIRMGKKIRFEPLVGELNLTRLQELLKDTEYGEIESLIVGTYIDAGDYIFVNSRLVAIENSNVLAGGNIKIKKGKYLAKLLKIADEKKSPATDGPVYERFPNTQNNSDDPADNKK